MSNNGSILNRIVEWLKRGNESQQEAHDGLQLCFNHRQEWRMSHYAEHNCDYCKLEKQNIQLRHPKVPKVPLVITKDADIVEFITRTLRGRRITREAANMLYVTIATAALTEEQEAVYKVANTPRIKNVH